MKDCPIGTIMTVPKSYKCEGWINYLEGMDLAKYKCLSKAIGSSYLPILGGIPVGMIQYGLSVTGSSTWVEWNSIISLTQYPELKKHIEVSIQALPLASNSRKIWEQALALDTLPSINNLFIKAGMAGVFNEGKQGGKPHFHYPVIMHTDNIMIPAGRASTLPPKELYRSITGEDVTESPYPSNMVLLAQSPSSHNMKEPAKLLMSGSDEGVGYPSNIELNVMINTQNIYPNVPSTHKLIIKCI